MTSRDYFTIAGVYWHGNGFLRVQVRTPDPYAECRGATFPPPSVCVMPRPPALSFPQYRLIAIRKDSLPSSVKRLYITEVADPSPIVIHDPPPPPPTSSQVMVPPSATPSDVTPLPQADWKLVAGSFTWKPESRNRIFYLRTPGQVSAWKYHVYDTDETRAALHQNFSRYGLLAVFIASWQQGSTIAGVYLAGDGALNVQIRAAPPPEPPDCPPTVPPSGLPAPCDVSLCRDQVPQYRLIAIAKDSLPTPVKRLYITEVP